MPRSLLARSNRQVTFLIFACALTGWFFAEGATASGAAFESTFYVAPIVGDASDGALTRLRDSLDPGSYHARAGFSVNSFYMSGTEGAGADFVFDSGPLREVLARSKKLNLPVVVILNGGPWGGTVQRDPSLNLIVHLEQDANNVQWKDDGTVPSDDEHLPGLGRILTYNNMNTEIRSYRQRNMQAAARVIAEFYRERPDLLIGVNTDPEIFMSPFYYSDYNPATITEFRLVQKAKFGGNLAALNAAMGKSFSSWGEVGPPRPVFGDAMGGDPWGEAWADFRIGLVDQEVQRQVDWIREMGIPADRIFTHQTVRTDNPFWSRHMLASPMETASVNGGSIGITTLQDLCFDEGLMAQANRWSPRWGIFELNPSNDPVRHNVYGPGYDWYDHYMRTYRALETAYRHGADVIAPYYWDREGNEPHYSIKGSAFEIAIRDFLKEVGTDTRRLWGQTSHGTAVSLSQASWGDWTNVVLLATSEHFADALAGVSLAYSFKHDRAVGKPVPLLLTGPERLSAEALLEMKRLNTGTAIILGGPGAVSPQVETQLRNNGIAVDRIWKSSSYGTAADVAERISRNAKAWGSFPAPDTAVITYGDNFQDALAISSPAAANNMPVLLSRRHTLTAETRRALATLGIKNVVIVGGEAVISKAVEAELAGLGLRLLKRFSGPTAYDTAADIATDSTGLFGFSIPGPIIVARGDHFTDGLGGGVVAARMNPAPIMLVEPNAIPAPTVSYISSRKSSLTQLYILGGPGAISDGVLGALDRL